MKNLIFPLLFLCLISCGQDEPFGSRQESPKTIVLKERPADNPWRPYHYSPDSLSLTRGQERSALGLRDYLGYSFQFNHSPIEDTRNLGCRIIDVKSLAKNYPSYFTYWLNASSEATSFSYSSFSDYSSKSEFSRTLTSGFDLKFLGFNLSHKKTHTTIFGETLTNDSKSVFGELNIVYRDSCYRMNYTSAIRQTIVKGYLDANFLQELHANNPYQFFLNYGGIVAVNYCSGGRATAIYTGAYKSDSTDKTKENDLNNEINTSYNWDKNTAGGNLTIGRKNGGTTTSSKNFSSVLVSVKSLGGLAEGNFSVPQELATASINLSSWAASLSDRSRHVISEFNQNGLVSLTDFIIEDNLKEWYETFISGQVPYYKDIVEPFVLINQIWGRTDNEMVYELYVITRWGRSIFLGRILGDAENASIWLDECQEMMTKVFNIKVVRSMWYPNSLAQTYAASNFQNVYYSNLFTHPEYYKKLSNKGILYLVDEVTKRGLSILDNPQVIREYGLTEFVSTLKPATISYSQMIDEDYKLNAL